LLIRRSPAAMWGFFVHRHLDARNEVWGFEKVYGNRWAPFITPNTVLVKSAILV
jgi:hypothetical protein